jgi:integrase/recombinase XerD
MDSRTPRKKQERVERAGDFDASRKAYKVMERMFASEPEAESKSKPSRATVKRRKAASQVSGMSMYTRENANGKWRYVAVRFGAGIRHPEPPYFLRFRDNGKQRLSQPYYSLDEAKHAAKVLRATLEAREKGVIPPTDKRDNDRTTVREAVNLFLAQKREKSANTKSAYRHHLEEFLDSLGAVRFLDEITVATLRHFSKKMFDTGLSAKTRRNRLMTVTFMLKKNSIPVRLPKDELPTVETEPAVAYTPEELDTLFALMDADEKLLFNFYLATGCREREVMFASWKDLDFAREEFHVRRKPDVGFTPKSHESRTIPIPTNFAAMLKAASKTPKHPRWIFVARDSKPDGHALRKLKTLALRAGLNCGNCRTTLRRDGKDVEVSCKTEPTCEHWYLHRLRKTAATTWLSNKINLKDIQRWLGHKDLATTDRYLGATPPEKIKHEINATPVR